MEIQNRKIPEGEFMAMRQEVLQQWPTGRDVDLTEAAVYQKQQKPSRNFSARLIEAKKEHKTLIQPRAGVPVLEEHIKLLQYLEKEGEADLLPTTIDSYTRLADALAAKSVPEFLAQGCTEKAARTKAEKKAIEDARYVLPNACETKMILTMNVRSLRNFFRLRCCNRAQWEIREVATEMLRLCCEVSPALFRTAGPSCYCGGCTEGKMSCGKAKEVRQKFEVIHGETR